MADYSHLPIEVHAGGSFESDPNNSTELYRLSHFGQVIEQTPKMSFELWPRAQASHSMPGPTFAKWRSLDQLTRTARISSPKWRGDIKSVGFCTFDELSFVMPRPVQFHW
jgi:hypothetical protein